jgi:hypothetical protein
LRHRPRERFMRRGVDGTPGISVVSAIRPHAGITQEVAPEKS